MYRLIGVVCCAAALTARAESVRLPEVTVVGEHEPASLTAPGLSLVRAELAQVAGGVTVVDAEEYKTGRSATLKDMLEYAPGVFVQPRFGAEEARISIRGSGLQRTFHLRGIKLLQDGVPVSSADGSADFQSIDPLALRYVELYRGANALRYGSTTLGGAVNFVMPTGHDAARAQARFEAGSFEYLRGQLSSGGVHDRFDYYVSLSHLSQDGFRAHAEQSNQRAFANLGYRVSDQLETRFYLNAAVSDSELPGNLTKAQLQANPRQANAFNVANDHERDVRYYRLANKTALAWDEQTLTLGAFYAYQDLDHPIFQVIDEVTRTYGADVRHTNSHDWGGRRNRFVGGINLVGGDNDVARFVNVSGGRGARTAAGAQRVETYELYLENSHSVLPALALVTGLQAAYTERDFRDHFLTDGDQSDQQDFAALNPKLGLLYDATEWAQLFVNVSRSFEPPTFGELANLGGSGLLQLDAQSAWTVEVGTRGKHERVAWELVWYHAWVRDELLGANVGPGNTPLTVNADRTLHQGVELGLRIEVVPGWFLRQAYLLSDFHFDNDATFGDNRLPGIPRHLYRTELLFEHPRGFYAGPNVEWSLEKYPVDMANTLFASSYAILGFKAGYRTPRGLAVFFEARNLTDETYAATTGVITTAGAPGVSSAQFLPGDGRAFYGGVEWRW